MKLEVRSPKSLLIAAMVVPLVSIGATAASAASCGDDIDGRRLACACGDVVVGDTTLRSSDPVVVERCTGDGLVIRARPGDGAVRLDLAGQTITGFGGGVGLRVLDGGAGGAVIVGGNGGALVGFRNGLRATRRGLVAEVRDLAVRGSGSDGVVLRGDRARLVRVRVEDGGRDGMWLSGPGVELDEVVAERNDRYGVRVTGRAAGRASVDGNGSGSRLGRGAAALSVESSR